MGSRWWIAASSPSPAPGECCADLPADGRQVRGRRLHPEFQDYFSADSAAYAEFRPRYPETLFAWLAGLAPGRRLAWDAGTGSGQAAIGLAAHFERVIATDASANQIANAVPHPRVDYRVAAVGSSGIEAAAVDLITAAQALHWFDRSAFYREARSTLVPDGILAVWTYGNPAIEAAVDAVVNRLYHEIVGPWWPPERRIVESGYRTLEFPFDDVATPDFELVAEWDLERLQGYMNTWSAVRRCQVATGRRPVEEILPALRAAWGDPARIRRVQWPLALRVGRRGGGAVGTEH